MRIRLCLFFIGLIILFSPTAIDAGNDSFRNDYLVEYTIPKDAVGEVKADVKFTITITNLKAQEYVDRISIAFPDSFKISDVYASDDHGPVEPGISTAQGKTQLSLAFNEPAYGVNTKNIFHLRLKQAGLVKATGNVYEVMAPTVKDTSSYEIIINLPPETDKKLSIAKPKPDNIENGKIIWKNPKAKTIYALFGDSQYYNLDLIYHLKNDKIIPVYQDIALPPDTLYQKIFVEKLEPLPSKTFRDADGNYMARILLKPKESIDVLFEGDAIVYANPREEIIENHRTEFTKQKEYLLENSGHFALNTDNKTLPLKTPREVFDYVTNTLTYNYGKVNKDTKRVGAQIALQNPQDAICTEFTDTFVALSRQNGIYAREIEGYGFSEDQHLRPLSLISDVLHAWPEYYNFETDLWQPVDPTWENTSGIDYFSSFDVNHIALVIHGKESEYPYPAGSYKFAETKDVAIQASSDLPTASRKVSIASAQTTTKLLSSAEGFLKITLRNEGNVYLWNETLSIDSDYIKPEKNTINISVLAPFEETELTIPFKSPDVKKKTDARLAVNMFDTVIYKTTVVIMPYYYKVAYIVSAVLLVCSLGYLLFYFIRNRYHATNQA